MADKVTDLNQRRKTAEQELAGLGQVLGRYLYQRWCAEHDRPAGPIEEAPPEFWQYLRQWAALHE
jgi:hypothetical protein